MSNLFHVIEDRHDPDPAFGVWRRARAEAIARDRLPVVIVRGEWPGRLLVVHEADFSALAGVKLDEALGNDAG